MCPKKPGGTTFLAGSAAPPMIRSRIASRFTASESALRTRQSRSGFGMRGSPASSVTKGSRCL